MRGLWPLAWRALRRRPARALSAAAATALAIAMVLTVEMTLGGLDAQALQVQHDRAGDSGLDVRAAGGATFDAAQVGALGSLPGVRAASALDEKSVLTVPATGSPAVSLTLVGESSGRTALRPVRLSEGRLPRPGADEIAIDRGLTTTLVSGRPLRVGDRLRLFGAAGPLSLTVVGISAGTTAGASFTETAGFVDDSLMRGPFRLGLRTPLVALQLAPGVSAGGVAAAVSQRLGPVAALDDPRSGGEPLADLRPLLIVMTVLILLVAAGVSASATALAAVERRRDLGLLRAAGAPAGLVLRLLGAEAVVPAAAGLVLGTPAGLVAGSLLAGATSGSAPPLAATTVLGAALTGALASLLGALVPAVLAARTPVLAVLRARPAAGASAARRLLGLCAAAALAAGGMLALATGTAPAVAGAVLVVVGAGLALPLLVVAAARAAAGLRRTGSVSPLLRVEARALRTGVAATCLAVCVGGAVAVSALATAAPAASEAWVTQLFPGQVLVHSPVTQRDAVLAALQHDGIAHARAIRFLTAPLGGAVVSVAVVDPATYADGGTFDVVTPSRTDALQRVASTPSVLVPAAAAASNGWAPGAVLRLTTPHGATNITVAGVVSHAFPSGDGGEGVIMSTTTATRLFGAAATGFDDLVLSNVSFQAAQDAVARYGMSATSVADIAAQAGAAVSNAVGLLIVMAAAAVTLALLAILNTLILNVRLSARDIALLRAAGMSQQQAVRLTLGGSLLVACCAAAAGAGAGMLATVPVLRTATTPGFALGFAVPVAALALILGAVLGTTLLAVWVPGRRSARMPVLHALAR